jgi:hypothetical protein
VKRSERIYRWLLRLYPRDFRDEYGQEMSLLFRARATDGSVRLVAAMARNQHRSSACCWARVFDYSGSERQSVSRLRKKAPSRLSGGPLRTTAEHAFIV